MVKTAIITICDNTNYGNRLQNYALQYSIKKLGIDNVTLWSKTKNTLKYKIKLIIKKILSINNLKYKKWVSFEAFTRKKIVNEYVDLNNLKLQNSKFDYFIVGSDQIWNYNFGHAKDKDFLLFADYEKTISYAPSFGISDIEQEWKDKISEGIKHIKYLSVRERRGSDIIKKLTNKDAQIVLDPTLLLTKDEWCKIQKRPSKMIKEEYILTYFLGEKTDKLKSEINKLSREKKLKVINLCDLEDKSFYSCGPSEFLYLFNHTQIVLTDSFHACVFSIIFNKPFFVFDRKTEGMKSMNSRLDTLLNTFKQESRKVDSLNNIEDIFYCEYDESYRILEKKKEESLEFLKIALNISNEDKEVLNG